jgi:IS30 family transposase
MERKYHHLRREDRNQIYLLHEAGISVTMIAEKLGVHKSTISRELKRNKDDSLGYLPDSAHMQAFQRRHRLGSKIERSKALQDFLSDYLAMGLSPEVMAGRLKLEKEKHVISHESIYKWIYGAGKNLKLHRYLIRAKRKRGYRPCLKEKTPRIPDRVSIHQRPEHYQQEFGHWEGDTVIFAQHQGALVTLYERQSKLILAQKVERKTAENVTGAIRHMLHDLPESARQSITFDNGTEFAAHKQVQDILMTKQTFFCDPYASWQKGGVENANGIIRRDIPKGTQAKHYSEQNINEIITQINNTPRKSLNFFTPIEIFNACVANQKTISSHLFNAVALQI